MTAGRYEIIDRLGEGESAVVYRARDLAQSGEEVALKVLKRSDEAEAARFRREFEVLGTLKHPNLIAVRDFGAGIPREQMRRIFELFYRAENELTRETVGTGIGLALVRQLVVAMSGRIDVVNREPGAEFRIDLPVTAPGED